ncbi:MAG: hypothetical protein JNM86_05995 [Phycisphaerae bacterium]|nr:hypothetical protein [Phycisphaerae bacterium]
MNSILERLALTLAQTASVAPMPPSALWMFAACVTASLIALAVVRFLKLDSLARVLLAPRPSRYEIVARLEQLAALADARDERGIRRTGDQCSWRLLRRGAELLADGDQPADIAMKLEHIAETLSARRVRVLRRIAAFSSGLVIFPLGVLVLHLLSVLGVPVPSNEWIAGAAFVGAISLLILTSSANWLSERAQDGLATRTIETEALIFGLSAIRGGAGPDDVGSMARLMLGLPTHRSALRRAA